MNKIIWEQLNSVKVVDLPPFDQNTTLIEIKKKEKLPDLIFQVDHYYLIELEKYIIDPPDGFTLHTNWNNNIIPTNLYYKCYCDKIMGKMVHILGVAFDYMNKTDLEENWDGWLPMKSVKILREI